ncbi:MAG: stage II sporulation protein D [Syntrophomonadaceae bacterium]|nr:stage II sporulation protein D [Syntrophomonadaceae bacterium]
MLIIAFCISIKNCPKTVSIKQAPEIKLYLSRENCTINLPLEDYIKGTVAAEMPANFALEALKAQAVCARTYTLKKILDEKKYPKGADVSDDIYSCQAYISSAEFKHRNPQNYKILWDKITKAVQATSGQIMIYNGEPIDALYHSTCGGRTESAANAWGQDIPYLRSVSCNYCQESKYYQSCQVFSKQDLEEFESLELGNTISLSISERSSTGRVKKLKINNLFVSGEKFRQILNLPSTNWEFSSAQGKLIVNSRGYGHGVGLCQYGANGMARAGADYRSILKHYYCHFDFCQLQWETNK